MAQVDDRRSAARAREAVVPVPDRLARGAHFRPSDTRPARIRLRGTEGMRGDDGEHDDDEHDYGHDGHDDARHAGVDGPLSAKAHVYVPGRPGVSARWPEWPVSHVTNGKSAAPPSQGGRKLMASRTWASSRRSPCPSDARAAAHNASTSARTTPCHATSSAGRSRTG